MRKTLFLYRKLSFASIRSQMQHRASFLMSILAQFISSLSDIFTLFILFDKFKIMGTWQLHELALLYGIVHTGFSLAEVFGRGFEKFHTIVAQREFDTMLLRPVGTFFQIAASETALMKLGRFFQGFAVLLWGMSYLECSFLHIFVLSCCFIGTTVLFYGVFVMQAALTFWLKETMELMNIITYGGRTIGQYPMTVFSASWIRFFTYIVPLSCVLSRPIGSLLHREEISLCCAGFLPLAGVFFLFISLQCWKAGVRHYCSGAHI